MSENNNKKERTLYLVIAVLVIVIVLLSKCEGNGNGNAQGGDPVLVKTDTVEVYIKGKTDTIQVVHESVVYVEMKPDTVEVVVDASGDSSNVFTTYFSDSLVYGSIQSKVRGQLLDTRFEYTPKFPQYIVRVDTVQKTITNEILKPRRQFYFGAIAGANATRVTLQPSLVYRNKKNQLFTAGYDVFNKTYHVGVFTLLKF